MSPFKDKEKRKEYYRQYWVAHKEEMKEQQRLSTNKLYHERKSRQLCVQCGQPVSQGGVYCLLHRSRRILKDRRYRRKPEIKMVCSDKKKAKYYKLKAENKCVYCRMPLNEESRMGISCLNCYTRSYRTGY